MMPGNVLVLGFQVVYCFGSTDQTHAENRGKSNNRFTPYFPSKICLCLKVTFFLGGGGAGWLQISVEEDSSNELGSCGDRSHIQYFFFIDIHNCSQLEMCNYISYLYAHNGFVFISHYFLKLTDRLEQIFPSRTGICTYILVFNIPKYLFVILRL